ncbi:hypothetical protein [Paenibacillus daejeonensis]|uniref:hypothetical protein n=1 Tax=Paenibacillus daejeonensis TaxID=135193 RepID=UPI00037A1F06|nr:hypothetical protein [Paenibacillus daejeonensis]
MKNQLMYGVLNGLLVPILSFILSFVLGVFMFNSRFAGSDYYGAIIYFPNVSIVVSILFSWLTATIATRASAWVNVLSALLAGGLYSLLSLIITKVYINNVDHFPRLNDKGFEFSIGYGIPTETIIFNGVILSLLTFIMSSRQKY